MDVTAVKPASPPQTWAVVAPDSAAGLGCNLNFALWPLTYRLFALPLNSRVSSPLLTVPSPAHSDEADLRISIPLLQTTLISMVNTKHLEGWEAPIFPSLHPLLRFDSQPYQLKRDGDNLVLINFVRGQSCRTPHARGQTFHGIEGFDGKTLVSCHQQEWWSLLDSCRLKQHSLQALNPKVDQLSRHLVPKKQLHKRSKNGSNALREKLITWPPHRGEFFCVSPWNMTWCVSFSRALFSGSQEAHWLPKHSAHHVCSSNYTAVSLHCQNFTWHGSKDFRNRFRVQEKS